MTTDSQPERLTGPNRFILESITDGLAALDGQWRFIYLNDSFARLVNRSCQDAIGQGIWELLPDYNQSGFGSLCRQVAQTGRPGEVDVYFSPIKSWFTIRVYPTDTGVSMLAFDVTKRKIGEEAQRQREERINTALKAARLGTWDWDLRSDEIYWNEGHFLLLGLEPHQSSQKSADFIQRVHPDDRQRVGAILETAIRDKVAYDAEFRVVREDGQLCWMSGYGRITAEAEGQPTRLSGIIYDITDRKLTEEALHESQERLQIVLDSVTDHAIITTDVQARITGWNPGAQKLFGFTDQDAIGQPIALIFTPEDRANGSPEAEINTALLTGRAADERYHERKDGTLFYASGVLSPLNNAAGQLLGYVKVARDLTERQQMEQALREADQRKDDFLAMLAHELRNPMAPIRNMLQIMKLTSEDNETVNSGVAMMSRQVDHLVRLIDDLLDVSRISRGQIELHLERLELTALVAQAVEAVRPLYAARQRDLQVTLPDNQIYLLGDSTRLTQVVTNLLTNGARYTQEGGQVWLSLEVQGQEAVLVVGDDGIGLAADQLNRVLSGSCR